MSRPMADIPKKSRRPRRQFDEDFKAQAVRLVLDERKTAGAVAGDLDLTETTLRNWVKQAQADRTHGRTGLTTAERDELARLRKENRVLREEREILKRRPPSSRTSGGEVSRHRSREGVPLAHDLVPLSAGDAQRVLRLGAPARVRPYETGSAPEGPRACIVLTRANTGMAARASTKDLREQDERVSRKRVIRL